MKVNSREVTNRLRVSVVVALLSIFLLLNISCSRREETYTTRKAKDSLSLAAEETGFAADVFLLLDQSGSMNGYPGRPATDPEGLRIQASKYLIRNIAQKSTGELSHRIGIVNFGTTAPADLTVPLAEVTKTMGDPGVQNLVASLRTLSMGDTSFISALNAAYQGFIAKETLKGNRKPVIIIFTDGEPDDPRKLDSEKYFQEMEDFNVSSLKPYGCDLYVIGIDVAGSTWAKSAPGWSRIVPPGRVYQINDMDELREKFNEAIRQIFGIPPVPPDLVTAGGFEFDVPPYLQKMEFHVFPEREGLTLSVFGPDGAAVDIGSEKAPVQEYETYDIITIMEPPHGKWRYEIVQGEGRIEVYRNAIPIKMELISPRKVHPLGKPMNLMASFLRPDGGEVFEIPEYPIGLTAKVIAPDGSENDIKFERGEKGLCFGTPSIGDINLKGFYRIILTMKGGDVYKSSTERRTEVRSMPYVMVDRPASGSSLKFSHSLPVEASLLLNGESLAPEKEFTDHPDYLMLAQVVQTPDGKSSESIWLAPTSDGQIPGRFHGILPVELKHRGRHVLMARLAGELRSGQESFSDYSEVSFSVQPSFWQRVYGRWPWMALFSGVIIAAFIVYGLQRPKLMGTLYVQKGAEEATSYNLRIFGHKATIGGSGSSIIIDPELKGKCGYLVAKRRKTDEGFKRSLPQVRYQSAPGSKTYTVKNLQNGDFVTIGEAVLEYRF